MWHAIIRIREFPREIEADLALNGLDIGWWHRGTLNDEGFPRLSSRRLLVLLDGLGENSMWRTEFERSGNWPAWMQMLQTVANEVSLHRASLYAGGDNEYAPKIWMNPKEVRDEIEATQKDRKFREKVSARVYRNLGWT